MSKRGQNEHTMLKDKKTGKWKGQVSLGFHPDGRRKRTSRTRDTRAELKAALDQAKAEHDKGTAPDPHLTVGEFLEGWIARGPESLEINTYDSYERTVRIHLAPALGHINLRTLTTAQVNAFLQAKRSDYEPRSVNIMRTTLHKALEVAVAEELVVRNVVSGSKAIPAATSPPKAMDAAQVQAFMAACDPTTQDGLCHYLTLMYGLRRGEVLGLRWSDLDIDARTLTISGTVVRHSSRDTRAGAPKTVLRRKDTPKTKSSWRTLVLTDEVASHLQRHRTKQAAARLKAGSEWSDQDLIICSPTGGPIDPTAYGKRFSKACENAGIGSWTPHALRHTYVSHLL